MGNGTDDLKHRLLQGRRIAWDQLDHFAQAALQGILPGSGIDPLRHLTVFDPNAWGMRPIHVIGAGATGSKVTHELARLGIRNIHVWDYDKVDDHNIGNQEYDVEHIGRLKVDALRQRISVATLTQIKTHPVAVDGNTQELEDVVFLLVDSMDARRKIFEGALKFNSTVSLMIETRMGADNGRIYTINPNEMPEVDGWVKTLYTDEEAEVSACGASVTVGPTANAIASQAVIQFLRWNALLNPTPAQRERKVRVPDRVEHELILGFWPPMIVRRFF